MVPRFDPVAAAHRIKQGRDDGTLYLAEGVKTIRDLLDAGAGVAGAVAVRSIKPPASSPRERLRQVLIARLEEAGFPVARISPQAFTRLSRTKTPQGLLLLARRCTSSPDELLRADSARVLYLDGIQDPVNVGALIRVAAALGASHLVRGAATADLHGEKAIRAAAGCQEKIPLLDDRSFLLGPKLHEAGFEFIASDAKRGVPPDAAKLRDKLVLVVSNEGSGLSKPIEPFVVTWVRIPLGRGVQSLNVAAAAAIILATWAR